MKVIVYKFLPIYTLFYHYIFSLKQFVYMRLLKLKLKSLGNYCQIYNAHIVEPYNVSIGHHVYINKGCDIITTGSEVEIGNYIMMGPNVTFVAQDHGISKWDIPMMLDKEYKRAKIVVEDDVWIGANTTILAGVTLGRGCVIAAGAVVTKDVKPYSIVGGVPASIIKMRFSDDDIEKASKIDLDKFSNYDINWKSWGVGKRVE